MATKVLDSLTSKMRTTPATAAAQSRTLSESLGHLRLLPSIGKAPPCSYAKEKQVCIVSTWWIERTTTSTPRSRLPFYLVLCSRSCDDGFRQHTHTTPHDTNIFVEARHLLQHYPWACVMAFCSTVDARALQFKVCQRHCMSCSPQHVRNFIHLGHALART